MMPEENPYKLSQTSILLTTKRKEKHFLDSLINLQAIKQMKLSNCSRKSFAILECSILI